MDRSTLAFSSFTLGSTKSHVLMDTTSSSSTTHSTVKSQSFNPLLSHQSFSIDTSFLNPQMDASSHHTINTNNNPYAYYNNPSNSDEIALNAFNEHHYQVNSVNPFNPQYTYNHLQSSTHSMNDTFITSSTLLSNAISHQTKAHPLSRTNNEIDKELDALLNSHKPIQTQTKMKQLKDLNSLLGMETEKNKRQRSPFTQKNRGEIINRLVNDSVNGYQTKREKKLMAGWIDSSSEKNDASFDRTRKVSKRVLTGDSERVNSTIPPASKYRDLDTFNAKQSSNKHGEYRSLTFETPLPSPMTPHFFNDNDDHESSLFSFFNEFHVTKEASIKFIDSNLVDRFKVSNTSLVEDDPLSFNPFNLPYFNQKQLELSQDSTFLNSDKRDEKWSLNQSNQKTIDLSTPVLNSILTDFDTPHKPDKKPQKRLRSNQIEFLKDKDTFELNDGIMRYRCKHRGCEYQGTTQTQIKSHLQCHAVVREYECASCPSKFVRKHDVHTLESTFNE